LSIKTVKQFCKNKNMCSGCVGCNPEGFYMDGEVTDEEALQMHGGKFTYCKACVELLGGGDTSWMRSAVLCESCGVVGETV